MNTQDRFPVPFYSESELAGRGYTVDDCVSREIKGCIYYMLKKDVAAELELSKSRKKE